jgi:peroxiredoxin
MTAHRTGHRAGGSGVTVLAGLLMAALAAAVLGWSPPADVLAPPGAGAAAIGTAGAEDGEVSVGREVEVGEPAPAFALPAVNGGSVALEDLRGRQPVLLVVWATWCPPCIQEFSELKRLHHDFSPRGLQILAIGVRYEQSADQVREFARDMGLPFPVLYDESSEVVHDYGISAIPSNYLIDRHGILRFKSNGLSPDIDQQVESLLGGA